MSTETRVCCRCTQAKSPTQFYRMPRGPQLDKTCKECRIELFNERRRREREEDRAKIKCHDGLSLIAQQFTSLRW